MNMKEESASSRRTQEETEGFNLIVKLGKSGDESSSFSYGAFVYTLVAGAIGVASMLVAF